MSKYKQTDIVGESWKRANKITFHNCYNETKRLSIEEEEVYAISDGRIAIKSLHNFPIMKSFTPENADTTFKQRNPVTEEITDQTYTYNDVYIMLHSLYYHLAERRDLEEKFTDPTPE